MPQQQYDVRLDDGRIVTVNAESEAEAARAARQWGAQTPAGSSADERGRTYARIVDQILGDVGVGRAGGALLRGFQVEDELTGAAASLAGRFSEQPISGQAAAQQSRENIARYRQEAPVLSLGEEFVASLPVGGPLGPMVGGAIGGGIAGAGSGETLQERVEQGALGAALGGATGGLFKVVAPAVGRLFGAARRTPAGSAVERSLRGAGDLRGLSSEEAEAFGELAAAFQADGMGPREVRRAVDAIASDNQAALADIIQKGGAVENLLLTAGRETPGARMSLTARNEALSEAGVQRVQDILRSNIGIGRVRPTRAALEAARREASEPLYAAFRRQGNLRAGSLNERGFGVSPDFKEALESAIRTALNQNDTDAARQLTNALTRRVVRGGEVVDINPNAELSPAVLDRVKRELDRRVNQAYDSGNRDLGAELAGLRNRYRDFLDEQYPDTYRAARDAYAGESANLTALQQGERLFKEDFEELSEFVRDMSDSEYEAFRLGASQALSARINSLQETSAAAPGRLLTGDAQDRIRLLFRGEGEAADGFFDQLRREAQRRTVSQRITPSRGGMEEEPPTPGETTFMVATELLNAQVGSAARRIVQDTRQNVTAGSRAARNRALARIATDVSRLPENAQELIFRQIGSEVGQEAERLVRDATRRAALGFGAQAGQREDRLTAERIRNMDLRTL